MEIKKILIPNKPHLDPIAAIYLLMKYGQEKFEGIDDAKIMFWEHSHNPTAEEIKAFEEQGVLMIDVGGGQFDHHDNDQVKETSTALIANHLGISQNPELSILLNYVREDDLEGLHNRYGELAYLLKVMYKQNTPSEEVVGAALQLLEIFQAGQMEWHYEVKKEYEQKLQLAKVKRHKKKLRIGVIESDNVQVANYGITQDNLSVVIQKRSSGHVMILTNKHHRIDLREIVAAIRKKELEVRGYNQPIDTKKLQFEGKSPQIPYWFYHRSLNSFLNGSDALAKTEVTQVPFKDIVKFVMYGLSTEESEYCDCEQGGDKCPYVAYGFSRCLEKRKGKSATNRPVIINESGQGYIAAILTKESEEKLKQLAIYPNVYSHHLTIAFRPNAETYKKYESLLNKDVEIRVIGIASDGHAQAVVVENFPTENSNPHITVSCDNETKPNYSNVMLEKSEIQPLEMILKAKVEFIKFS